MNTRLQELENKQKARQTAHGAIRIGLITKPDKCSRCHKPASKYKLNAHHDDYDKPLEVIWLCSSCHSIEHQHNRRKSSLNDRELMQFILTHPTCRPGRIAASLNVRIDIVRMRLRRYKQLAGACGMSLTDWIIHSRKHSGGN